MTQALNIRIIALKIGDPRFGHKTRKTLKFQKMITQRFLLFLLLLLFLAIIHPYLFITIDGKGFYITFVGESTLYQPPVVLIRNRLNRISLLY